MKAQTALSDLVHRRLLWWGGVIVLLLTAFAWRVYGLADVPPGLQVDDERWNIEILDQVQRGEWALFFSHGWGREGLFYYLLAVWAAMVGENYAVLRLLPTFAGVLTVALTIRLGRQLWNRRVGWLAGAGVAVNLWPLFYNRILLRASLLPPLFLGAAILFWDGLRQTDRSRRRSWAIWLGFGLVYGLCFYAYTSARVLPFLFLAVVVYLWAAARSGADDRSDADDRSIIRVQAAPMLAGFTLTLLLILPLAWTLLRIDGGALRLDQVGAPLQALRAGQVGPLIEAVGKTLSMFFVRGSESWRYNWAGRPVFDPLGGALFVLGLLIALRRSMLAVRRQHACVWLVLWWAVGLLPGLLSADAPSAVRTILSMPATLIFPALALDALWNWLGSKAWLALAALSVLYLGLMGGLTWRDYMLCWPNQPEVREIYQADLTQAVRRAEAQAETVQVGMSVVLDGDRDPYTITHTRRSTAWLPRLFDGRYALVAPAADPAALIALENVPLAPRFEAMLRAEARVQPSERVTQDGRPIFTAYNGSLRRAVEARRAASAQATLAGMLPVSWGDVLLLRGYELPNHVRRGEAAEIVEYWQVIEATTEPWVVFVHLLNDKGEWVAGYDRLDVYAPSLQPGDLIVQTHAPWISPDLPPGEYRVMVGVYHRETMQRLPGDAGDALPLALVRVD